MVYAHICCEKQCCTCPENTSIPKHACKDTVINMLHDCMVHSKLVNQCLSCRVWFTAAVNLRAGEVSSSVLSLLIAGSVLTGMYPADLKLVNVGPGCVCISKNANSHKLISSVGLAAQAVYVECCPVSFLGCQKSS